MATGEQLPSDSLLDRLRGRVDIARRTYSNVSLLPDQVLALVKCAEIVQTDYLLLSDDQRMKALRALKELGL